MDLRLPWHDSAYIDSMCAKSPFDPSRPAFNALVGQLVSMLSFHSRVLAVEMTIYGDSEINGRELEPRVFADQLRACLRNAKRVLGLKRVAYFWARERSINQITHWHLVLFVDGHLFRCGRRFMGLFNRKFEDFDIRWCRLAGDRSQRLVRRNDQDSFEQAVIGLSYYAKSATKIAGESSRSFGSSRLQPRG